MRVELLYDGVGTLEGDVEAVSRFDGDGIRLLWIVGRFDFNPSVPIMLLLGSVTEENNIFLG
jgi:hypothetical protein